MFLFTLWASLLKQVKLNTVSSTTLTCKKRMFKNVEIMRICILSVKVNTNDYIMTK